MTVIDTEYIGGAGPNGMVGEDVTAGPNPSSLNDGCKVSHEPGCDYCKCEACVCEKDSWCCEVEWSEVCVQICDEECGGCGFTYTCGNDFCEVGEECGNCPEDCGPCATQCGDGTCDTNEDCESCPNDCGECVTEDCGNGNCDAGESCAVCPEDCGECAGWCGDGKCEAGEACEDCPADCGECPVPVDPLNVIITYPPRGFSTTESMLEVTGVISGGEPPYELTVNGAPDGAGPDGSFDASMTSVHGMNLAKAEVKDSAGNKAAAVHAYYYANYFYPSEYGNPSLSMVKDGIMAFLGKEVWDDDDPSDLDDIATVIIMLVEDQDLGALIPSPVTSGDAGICDYEVFIENVQWGKVDVDLVPVMGGLATHIMIPNFKTDVEADLDGIVCPDISGEVKIDSITIDVTMYVSADGAGGVQVSAGQPSVGINDIDVELDNDILDFLIAWLINWFANEYADKVEDMFEDTLKDQINGAIGQSIESLAWEQMFEVPLDLGIGPPVTLKAVLSISTVDFTSLGGTIGIQATMLATKGTLHQSPGSISNEPCKQAEVAPFVGNYKFEVALYDDLLNQIPFSLFWGGLFTIPVPPEMMAGLDLSDMGLELNSLELDFLLPPILTDCQKEDYVAQIGDISTVIDLLFMGKEMLIDLYASVEIAVEFTLVQGPNGQEVGAEVTPTKVEVDVAGASVVGATPEQADALKAMIESMIGTQLVAVFDQQIAASFPIPDMDLTGLHPMIPPGTKIKIDAKTLERKWGYTVFSGDVSGVIEP